MVTACRYQPSFFSTLLLSLDFFFKPWAGLPYLCCIHSRVYRADLKSLFFQVLRYQKRGGWSLCPLQAQSKPAIVLLWHPENPLLVQNSFCSSHSIMSCKLNISLLSPPLLTAAGIIRLLHLLLSPARVTWVCPLALLLSHCPFRLPALLLRFLQQFLSCLVFLW